MSSRKKTTKKKSNSDKEIPLPSLKKQLDINHGVNSSSVLCQPTSLNCEFCPKKFDNQLQFLVHNGQHIIIPVEKLDPQITSSTQVPSFNTIEDEDTILKANIDWLAPEKNLNESILSTFTEECKVSLEMLPLPLNNETDLPEPENDEVLQSFLRDCEVDLGFRGFDMLLEPQITDAATDKSTTDKDKPVSVSSESDVEEVITIDDTPVNATEKNSKTTEENSKIPLKKRKVVKVPNGPKSKRSRKRTSLPLNVDVMLSNNKGGVPPMQFEQLIDSSQNFECMFCHKQFDNWYNQLEHCANQHIKVNLNFKKDVLTSSPYFCDMCQKFFTQFDVWKAHVTETHKDKVERILKCKNCRQVYAFGKKRHKKMFHRDFIKHCNSCQKYNCKKHIYVKVKKKGTFTCEVVIDGVSLPKNNESELKNNENTILKSILTRKSGKPNSIENPINFVNVDISKIDSLAELNKNQINADKDGIYGGNNSPNKQRLVTAASNSIDKTKNDTKTKRKRGRPPKIFTKAGSQKDSVEVNEIHINEKDKNDVSHVTNDVFECQNKQPLSAANNAIVIINNDDAPLKNKRGRPLKIKLGRPRKNPVGLLSKPNRGRPPKDKALKNKTIKRINWFSNMITKISGTSKGKKKNNEVATINNKIAKTSKGRKKKSNIEENNDVATMNNKVAETNTGKKKKSNVEENNDVSTINNKVSGKNTSKKKKINVEVNNEVATMNNKVAETNKGKKKKSNVKENNGATNINSKVAETNKGKTINPDIARIEAEAITAQNTLADKAKLEGEFNKKLYIICNKCHAKYCDDLYKYDIRFYRNYQCSFVNCDDCGKENANNIVSIDLRTVLPVTFEPPDPADNLTMPVSFNPRNSRVPVSFNSINSQVPVKFNPGNSQVSISFNPINSQVPASFNPINSQVPASFNPGNSQVSVIFNPRHSTVPITFEPINVTASIDVNSSLPANKIRSVTSVSSNSVKKNNDECILGM